MSTLPCCLRSVLFQNLNHYNLYFCSCQLLFYFFFLIFLFLLFSPNFKFKLASL
ncbi:hypothetical protein Sinf_1079 [Streptococcus infantarius subsp. infantarius CJ18]|nr:hypothetical protein Sinf_1079 [Streptococcus infantarius subsp. infantarius CJ18]